MYYEIYLDSLLLLQFCLNLYLLELVNRMLYQVASWKRVFGGAALGAVCSVLPFLLPIKLGYSMLGGFLLSVTGMTLYTFRTYRAEQFLKVLEKMFVMTLLLGGVLLLFIKRLPNTQGTLWGISSVLALGTVSYIVVRCLTGKERQKDNECMVTLEGTCGKLQVKALLDTGNSLIEPISGEPVAVLSQQTFQALFGEKSPELYRAIPYHSVGKSNGILKGYQIKQVIIEVQGVKKECDSIYIAVSEELVAQKSNYKMILNPRMLEK
ncbi:MAG: sigma-E processing peptidase SpoIIGA [Lachnospiraceae bacterium]|nr:sigma-E processing peptidase SpoIIGA [Lachnospiraceae bacterium]